MKYCRECGTQLLDTALICPKCGSMQKNEDESPKSRLTALLLCVFFGVIGIHRFYVGRTGSGVAMLLLGWMTLGIWPLIDLILIITGVFKDGEGKTITSWGC